MTSLNIWGSIFIEIIWSELSILWLRIVLIAVDIIMGKLGKFYGNWENWVPVNTYKYFLLSHI